MQVGADSRTSPLERAVLTFVSSAATPVTPLAVHGTLAAGRVMAIETVTRAVDGLVARGALARAADGTLTAMTTLEALERKERTAIAPTAGFRPGLTATCEPWPPRPSKCC